MITILYGSEREYGYCEPNDTIADISSYTHYTAYELCNVIDGIIKGKLQIIGEVEE